jgi:hypothetical protein
MDDLVRDGVLVTADQSNDTAQPGTQSTRL